MRSFAAAVLAGLCLSAPASALAGQPMRHYAAEPSETLAQALANFAEYNAKVRDVLAKDQLSGADLERVHEYTYTLEDALAKMREELAGLAVTLEALHVASEGHNPDAVRGVGEVYLETAEAFDG